MLTMTGAAKIVNNIIKCGEKYSVRYIWKNMIKKCPKLFSSFRSSVIQTHYILLYLPILGWGRCCLLSHSLDPILFMQNIRVLQQPSLLLPLKEHFKKTVARPSTHQRINENYTKEWRHLPVPFKYVYFIAWSDTNIVVDPNNDIMRILIRILLSN